jgi:hypothetical protein
MDGVSAGDYLVRVSAPEHIPTWYPESVDAAHATAITVDGGVTELRPMLIGIALGSITIGLDVDDPSDVRVTVRLASGSAVPGAIVADAVQTDVATVFLAENLPTPGRFVVVAQKEGYLMASIPVDLSLGQQRDVDTVSLPPIPAAPTPVPTSATPPTATTPPTTPPGTPKPPVPTSAAPTTTSSSAPTLTPAARRDDHDEAR